MFTKVIEEASLRSLKKQVITVSLHYLPRCLRLTITCGETPATAAWSEHMKNWVHVIVAQQRPTIKQSARKLRNPPLQAKERTWVDWKLITAWIQNSEPGSCAVWVSYRQINCQLFGIKLLASVF